MDNGKIKRLKKKISVYGIVQGVGFRPLVYRIAKKHNIRGTVRNLGGYVEIIAEAVSKDLEDFIFEMKNQPNSACEIIRLEVEEDHDTRTYHDFRIIQSAAKDIVSILPPDLPVCPQCQKELMNSSDRRYNHPLISCMLCGPRYTIIEELPYDRHTITMRDFKMCEVCEEEYTSPEDRRFHAQTISCHDCGPNLIWSDSHDREELYHQEALEEAAAELKAGKIIAVKGIGGYHYVCSPMLEGTVENLRMLKGREEKPFAVMFETIDSIKRYCKVSEEERQLLESSARPIVLLYQKENSFAPSTNKQSIYCGAFLPYTPIQILLTKQCGPLIMTSANSSNQPIIKEDDQILEMKSTHLAGVLYHKRRIVRSVDDSVAKVISHQVQMIRRSRGYVPYPVNLSIDNNDVQLLAMGGDLKAAYCLYQNGNAVVSQYFGDLEEVSVMEEYQHSIQDLSHLLRITPQLIVSDMHPNYNSTKYAKTFGIPILKVQHHHAHIASVMAEHQLMGPVIGVAFDGTGYGTDGNVWGGEFLLCEDSEFIREAHLNDTPMLGGDQSMRDAKKTATCFLLHYGLEQYIRDERIAIVKAALHNKVNTVLTSSMGRLFDAVSSLLGICHENHYEGECAILLEKEAYLAQALQIEPVKLSFAYQKKDEIIEIDQKPLFEAICRLRDTEDVRALALGFHDAVADLIVAICQWMREKYRTNLVALSGGVFQNSILMELSLRMLTENHFEVYCNHKVPPNDGCISLGQTYIGINTFLK